MKEQLTFSESPKDLLWKISLTSSKITISQENLFVEAKAVLHSDVSFIGFTFFMPLTPAPFPTQVWGNILTTDSMSCSKSVWESPLHVWLWNKNTRLGLLRGKFIVTSKINKGNWDSFIHGSLSRHVSKTVNQRSNIAVFSAEKALSQIKKDDPF